MIARVIAARLTKLALESCMTSCFDRELSLALDRAVLMVESS